jgi:hypothetical protein
MDACWWPEGENSNSNIVDAAASIELYVKTPVIVQLQSNGYVFLHTYGSPGETFDFQASTNPSGLC